MSRLKMLDRYVSILHIQVLAWLNKGFSHSTPKSITNNISFKYRDSTVLVVYPKGPSWPGVVFDLYK